MRLARPLRPHGAEMTTRRVSGRIVVVQEQRFRLLTDDGQAFLLTLSRDAPLDGVDLERVRASGARVVVEYEGEPNLESGVARSVTLTEAPRPAAAAIEAERRAA